MGEAYPLRGDGNGDAPPSEAAEELARLRDAVAALQRHVEAQSTRLERLDAFTETMFARVERAVRAGLPDASEPAPAQPGGLELSGTDRDALAHLASRLDRIEARLGGVPEVSLGEDDRALLTTVVARLDAIDARIDDLPAPPSPGLSETDRETLNAILRRVEHPPAAHPEAATEERADAAAVPRSVMPSEVPTVEPEDIQLIRAQAIQDLADAIERATGGLSRRRTRKLQRSLDRAASRSAESTGRPVRKPKAAPAGPQRQVVRLEREPSEPSQDPVVGRSEESEESEDRGEPDGS